MNLALLSHLKRRPGQWLDAHALARELHVSLHLLARELQALDQAGYRIERDPLDGVRLLAPPEGLVASEIECDLGTRSIGRRILVHGQLTSTNTEAWRLIRRASPSDYEGAVILADQQTAGRGRLGRSWASPPGGLWMSAIVRSPLAARHRPMLTIAAAVAIVQTVRDLTQLEARIRWPNDVIVGGRKLAGVLVETQSDFPDLCVLGVGVNVNVPLDDLPPDVRTAATSLRVELGGEVSLVSFARGLLRHVDAWHGRLHGGELASLNAAWRQMASTLGQRTVIVAGGRRFEGVVVELDLAEGLSLRLDRGVVRTFRSEEVSSVDVLE